MQGYDVAQICLNGHVICSMAIAHPNNRRDHCTTCGARTIMNCPNCDNPIKGYYHAPGVISLIDYHPPRFCEKCGEPYPWIKFKLEASRELVDLIESLSDYEKNDLKISIEDLIRDSAKKAVSKIKFQKYLIKIDNSISDGLKDLLKDCLKDT